jgi:pyruvate, water dikinase
MPGVGLLQRWYTRILAPDLHQRQTYDSFRKLLQYNSQCHELIADLQDLYHKDRPVEWLHIIACYEKLYDAANGMVTSLNEVANRGEQELFVFLKKIDNYIRFLLAAETHASTSKLVSWLDDKPDPGSMGNKAANLCLIRKRYPEFVPQGFIVTSAGWMEVIEHNHLREEINQHLMNLDLEDISCIRDVSLLLQNKIKDAEIPPRLQEEVEQSLEKLGKICIKGKDALLAIRSSAVSEDGSNSYAGQYTSMLDVSFDCFWQNYLEVLASKYSPEAILYRITTGIKDQEAPMAVLVLEMVPSQFSGVVYTEDPTGDHQHTTVIHCVEGIGEKLVSGCSLASRHLINKKSGEIEDRMITPQAANSELIKKLARIGDELEEYFEAPQDIEWAVVENDLYLLQSRPLKITDLFSSYVVNENDGSFKRVEDKYQPDLRLVMSRGLTGAKGKASGTIHIYEDENSCPSDLSDVILLVENIPPSLILMLSSCSGVIATGGSSASHFATICREFGIPLIVAAENAKDKLHQGQQVTMDSVDCHVYEGIDQQLKKDVVKNAVTRVQLPYYRRLQTVLEFVAPLTVLDPDSKSFAPGACRSMHDIVRYSHEKGVQAMFDIGKSGSRHAHKKKLNTDLPFNLYTINVDKSRKEEREADDGVDAATIESIPFKALWKGLTHESIIWGDREYYNWKEYDNAAMTDGFAFKNEADSASYAICGKDYMNLNIKFGYHFTLVDCLCGDNAEQNYCSLQFAGGGGTFEGRWLRLRFIEEILRKIGFRVQTKTDLIDARMENLSRSVLEKRLVTLGRMLGTTKLMDMVLKDESSIALQLNEFFRWDD